MPKTCECGMHVDDPARRTDCHDCGGACCRSCQIDVDTRAYCRWCASTFIAA
jgi:hypothetical protein